MLHRTIALLLAPPPTALRDRCDVDRSSPGRVSSRPAPPAGRERVTHTRSSSRRSPATPHTTDPRGHRESAAAVRDHSIPATASRSRSTCSMARRADTVLPTTANLAEMPSYAPFRRLRQSSREGKAFRAPQASPRPARAACEANRGRNTALLPPLLVFRPLCSSTAACPPGHAPFSLYPQYIPAWQLSIFPDARTIVAPPRPSFFLVS